MPVSQQDEGIVESLFKAMQMSPAGEELMMSLFADDATFIEPFSGQVQTHKGKQAIRDSFAEMWKEPPPDMKLNVERVDVDGEQIRAEWNCTSPVFPRNDSRFPPQEKNHDGERHRDWSIYSFDSARKKVVLRQFHGEGYVNQYVLERISDQGKRLTFVTEAVENGPPGMRARLTISLKRKNKIEEDFDLAFPGKDFELCVRTTLTRK